MRVYLTACIPTRLMYRMRGSSLVPTKRKSLAKPTVRRYHNAGTAVSILDRTLLLRCEGVDIFRRQAGVEPWQFKSQGRGLGALRYSSLNL